jgi:hypothetical protein
VDDLFDQLASGDDVPGGGTVFNAGCTDWTYGIAGGDADVRQVTRNVLDRLSA